MSCNALLTTIILTTVTALLGLVAAGRVVCRELGAFASDVEAATRLVPPPRVDDDALLDEALAVVDFALPLLAPLPLVL
jgi:hypothetical protein